ncbi:MAG: chemotaxis protein CheW [Synechococcales bacterium]|nr:chemotaxis protein CheW [Synechococcales bacterium]
MAIAALMNRHLNRQQMSAQVDWEGNRLHILITAVRPPNPELLTSALCRAFLKLQISTLKTLKVSCQEADTCRIVWSQERAIASNSAINSATSAQSLNSTRQPPAAPISIQDWLNQKAQASLADLIQPISATSDLEAELRFLRFSFNTSETALLPLNSIRQVMKVQPQNLVLVPDMPAFVVGICNFHGEILWMVDLGLQLGFQEATAGRDGLRLQFYDRSVVVPSQPTLMAIVIQAHGKSLGLVVSQIIDIESHNFAQIQPPTTDLFPLSLLPFIQGYLVCPSNPVLDANALIGDRRLQVHAA